MLSSHIFRISLLASLSIHIFLVSPWSGLNLSNKDKKINKNIEVHYSMPEEINEEILDNIPQKYALKKDDTTLGKSEPMQEKYISSKPEEDTLSISEEISENLEEYIQYYELIRERIKKIVSNEYKGRKNGGEVSLIFILNSSGILKDASYIPSKSSSDKYLIDIALKSLKDASPFPVFPGALKKESLSFNLTVVFKK